MDKARWTRSINAKAQYPQVKGHAIQEKRLKWCDRHEKLILQLDARPHIGQPVWTYLEGVKWEVLLHPPYLPDIVSSD
ncbi:hypothetical protein Trydic_g4492 [Trypoxylus dichotomus]